MAAARPAAIAAFRDRHQKPILIVAPRQETADRLAMSLSAYLPAHHEIQMWSAPDPLPYEQMPHDAALSARRIETMGVLRHPLVQEPPVIVTTSRAIAVYVRSPESFDRDTVSIKLGQRLDMRALQRSLVDAGYVQEPVTSLPGTFSRRGGIIDVYSPGQRDGVRIEFFGDEVDSIRRFDPVTQRSTDKCSTVTLLPSLEFDLSNVSAGLSRLAELDADGLRPEVRDEWIEVLQRLAEGDTPEAVDLISTAFPGNHATLLDYLPADTMIVQIEPESLRLQAEQMELRAVEVRQTLETAREIPEGFDRPFANWDELSTACRHFDCWSIGQALPQDDVIELSTHRSFADPAVFGGKIDDVVSTSSDLLSSGWSIVFASEQSERLTDILTDSDIYPRVTKRGASAIPTPPGPGTVDVVHAQTYGGFSVPGEKLLVLTDLEVFGIRKAARPPVRPRPARPSQLSRFTDGSYVVHVEHGVGVFRGLTTMATTGVDREYLQVDYADGDRLYVPVDQADRLSPYQSPAGQPKITKLSSPEWARSKSRVRKAVREMAYELLQIYAARETARGHAFPPDTTWDSELSEAFPFTETVDQERAINDVKGDMESPRPMDRLVCGDVGYGKTEVALRAAFKAVNDGWQVAILVPTTVLALQHLSTFSERLSAFPVNVEMLSRLRSRSQQRDILKRLEAGEVDIVIGTHRLLQRDVKFKRLGLLVVDEEQRFGVTHKEHIKRLRAEIDILTMTATPIPRTLHLALTGVRDLSLITTPPQERVPIRTFVTTRDENVVREAILRELARGGQVYVVHNRVHSIFSAAEWLRDLVPEATFEVGHGQMDEKDLERIIVDFMQHKFDVLVCTTIIESGVDIPNANTMIIDNAHSLGLTQLYQLRGRVGRGANRAYAYLLYPPNIPLSIEATERLEAIQEATDLGAGFQIAMRDMEIRGVGNVLGAEQSGHIAAVGLDLYTRMLARAVEEIRAGHPIVDQDDVTIDIAVDARIPEDYVEDENVRLTAYQRIAEARNGKALRDIADELRDRFGEIPEPVSRLLDLVGLRHRAGAGGITSIVERDGNIIIRPVIGSNIDSTRLRRDLGDGVRVTPNQVRLSVDNLKIDRWNAIASVLREAGVSSDAVLAS